MLIKWLVFWVSVMLLETVCWWRYDDVIIISSLSPSSATRFHVNNDGPNSKTHFVLKLWFSGQKSEIDLCLRRILAGSFLVSGNYCLFGKLTSPGKLITRFYFDNFEIFEKIWWFSMILRKFISLFWNHTSLPTK